MQETAQPRRWWGFAERLDRAEQIGQGFTDGNQTVAFTLHSLILPWDSDTRPQNLR